MTWTLSSARPSDYPLYGAIDLGTNTCRLLIGQPVFAEEGFLFSAVNSFSRIIRFGEDVEQTGRISSHAIERALVVLEECARRLDCYDVAYTRSVATAACRQAQNAHEFTSLVKEKIGLDLEIISFREESELAVAGCIDLLDPTIPYSIVFDIGGGSTEIVWIEMQGALRFRVLDCLSLPYGVLSLRDPICSLEKKIEIGRQISFEVNEFAIRNGLYDLMHQSKIQMVGASGTVTTLAAMILNLERYDRARVHKVRLWKKDLENLIQHLFVMNRTDRTNHPCIGPQRTDFIMGGVAIFQGIYDILTIEPTIVADRGVREGILRYLFERYPPSALQAMPRPHSAA